jgi:hypothetical protein
MKTQTIDHCPAASESRNGKGSKVLAAGRRMVGVWCSLLAIGLCLTRDASAQQSSPSSSQTGRGTEQNATNQAIPMFLANSVDSKKAKPGEQVTGKMATTLRLKDGTVVSRGTKILGQVTEAKARSKGDVESSLRIVFDKISLPGGKDLTITGVIQAVAPPPKPGESPWAGVGYGSIDQSLEKPPTPHMDPKALPILNEQSEGVLGIKDLQLGADGVLTSDQKSVKLDSGTQIMIHAQIGGN